MTSLAQLDASKIKDITSVSPVAIVAFAVAAILMLLLPRNKVLIPFFIVIFLIPFYQVISIFSLNFYLCRILVIIGLIRIVIRSEISFGNKIDKIFALMVLSRFIANIALWQTGHAVASNMGYALDMLGAYILIRSLIRSFEDIDTIIKVFVFLAFIIAIFMVNGQLSGKNILSSIGGTSGNLVIRNGNYRSEASLAHPILAGDFGAIFLPLFVYLWLHKKIIRYLGMIGIGSCLIIVYTSYSSGPMLSLIAGLVGIIMFPFRKNMKTFRRGLFGLIIALQLIMKAPVWALIERLGVIGGSSSYHRYVLVDQFIRRFDEWWLFGTKSTNHWGWNGVDLWDVANGYVLIGVEGGIITFIIFIFLLIRCFSAIGTGLQVFEQESDKIFLYWSLGTMLAVHLIAFWGVSYFAQMTFVWILTLCMISTLSDLLLKSQSIKVLDNGDIDRSQQEYAVIKS